MLFLRLFTCGLCFVAASGLGATLAGPFTNTANGHIYYLLTQSDWLTAQKEAERLGGNLVTINGFLRSN